MSDEADRERQYRRAEQGAVTIAPTCTAEAEARQVDGE